MLHNATSLFDAEIEGYGGDPAFHRVQGVSQTGTYSGQIDLKANNTVTLACGYGKNKTNISDTTGLFAQVVLLSGQREIAVCSHPYPNFLFLIPKGTPSFPSVLSQMLSQDLAQEHLAGITR